MAAVTSNYPQTYQNTSLCCLTSQRVTFCNVLHCLLTPMRNPLLLHFLINPMANNLFGESCKCCCIELLGFFDNVSWPPWFSSTDSGINNLCPNKRGVPVHTLIHCCLLLTFVTTGIFMSVWIFFVLSVRARGLSIGSWTLEGGYVGISETVFLFKYMWDIICKVTELYLHVSDGVPNCLQSWCPSSCLNGSAGAPCWLLVLDISSGVLGVQPVGCSGMTLSSTSPTPWQDEPISLLLSQLWRM